jgi:hypothetical protein
MNRRFSLKFTVSNEKSCPAPPSNAAPFVKTSENLPLDSRNTLPGNEKEINLSSLSLEDEQLPLDEFGRMSFKHSASTLQS